MENVWDKDQILYIELSSLKLVHLFVTRINIWDRLVF